MKLCYALRRGVYYPSQRDAFGELPSGETRRAYLRAVKRLGFAGLEVPASSPGGASEEAARGFRRELEEAELPALCVRAGGPIAHPRDGAATLTRLREAVRFASWVGAEVVNVTCVTPATLPGGPGANRTGEPVSQGSSRGASEADYELTAARFRDIGRLAGDLGLEVSVEVHQGSIVDNSWSARRIAELVALPNFGVNPDLGNIYWQYDVPEETSEAAIVALAPLAKYWHCKNLKRVHAPGLPRAIFLQVPLPDGDIDYRFAISAMVDAGYQGCLAVEGVRLGDQLTADGRSAAYVREILADRQHER